MRMIKTTGGETEPLTTHATGQFETSSQARSGAELPHRNIALDWDQMMSDYTVIERRAQAMRAEVAWEMARAFGNWVARIVSHGKAKAGAAATPLTRQGQPT